MNRKGEEVHGMAWSSVENRPGTFCPFKYSIGKHYCLWDHCKSIPTAGVTNGRPFCVASARVRVTLNILLLLHPQLQESGHLFILSQVLEDIHPLLRTVVHNPVSYLSVRTNPFLGTAQLGWDNSVVQPSLTGVLPAMEKKQKRKKGKCFSTTKTEVVTDMTWGRTTTRKVGTKKVKVRQGGSRLNWLWPGFSLRMINLHASHLSCTTTPFICKCWICAQL